jgi:hypothetical protein
MARTKGALNKHKKEKPVKEKKKRGRKPGSIKQKQEQHQVVNVNINSKEGTHRRSTTRKEKKKQVQNPMPNIIFNPSINTPSYGFPVNKAETNPPYYDMNSLMQPIQNKPVIKPVDVKPDIETVPSAIPIPKQPPPLPTPEIPTGIPINSKIVEEIVKPVEINPTQSKVEEIKTQGEASAPSYESYETPTEEQKKEHDEKFKKVYEKLKTREDKEGLGRRIPVENVLKSTALAALGGGGVGALNAFVAGTPIIEGAVSGATISTLANLGNEIAGEKGAAIGGAIGTGLVARNEYNKYKKKQQQTLQNEIAPDTQQQEFDNFLETTQSSQAKKTRKRRATMTNIPEDIPTPIFVTQDEAHNLDFKPRKSLPQAPRTKEELQRERELIDYKKELFEQNLKRALTPQEKEDEYKEFVDKFIKDASDKNTERFLKRDKDAVAKLEGAFFIRGSKERVRSKRQIKETKKRFAGLLNTLADEQAAKETKSRQNMQDFLTGEYERAAETYAKTEASKIINSAAKRAITQPAYNEIITDIKTVADAATKINSAAQAKIQRNRYLKGMERVRKYSKLQNTQSKIAFDNFSSALNQQQTADKLADLASKAAADKRKVEGQISLSEMARKQRIADSLSKLVRNKMKDNADAGGEIKQKKAAINTIQKVVRGHQSRKDLRNDILNTASKEKQAATLLQNNIRMHQARKEQDLEKKVVKRRAAAQQIAAQAKTKLTYQFKDARKDLAVKHTGKPLVVQRNTKELILKERHNRGIKAAQSRGLL